MDKLIIYILIGMYIVFDNTKLSAQNDSVRQNSFYTHQRIPFSEPEILDAIDKTPAFAVYKDTYFITGIPTNKKINSSTADAKFQISFRQLLTRSVLPFKTFLFLTYTQKSFWNVYEESSPFSDNNYNPGLGLGRYFLRDNHLIGNLFVQIAHESNGRSGEESRSWNYAKLAGKYFYNPNVSLAAEIWIPYVDGGKNKNLIDYKGLGQVTVNYLTTNNLFWASCIINPRKKIGNTNITLALGYKLSARANQYLFAQFENGYAESLLKYNQFQSHVRIGICIKPDFFDL